MRSPRETLISDVYVPGPDWRTPRAAEIPETVKIEYAARMATLGGVAERAAWVPDIAPRQRPQPHHL